MEILVIVIEALKAGTVGYAAIGVVLVWRGSVIVLERHRAGLALRLAEDAARRVEIATREANLVADRDRVQAARIDDLTRLVTSNIAVLERVHRALEVAGTEHGGEHHAERR